MKSVIFRTTVEISSIIDTNSGAILSNVMVDTGSEYNWVPETILQQLGITPQRMERFQTADGRMLQREVGFAMLYVRDRSTPTIVAFAQPGDLVLLGALGLEGLNMRVDLGRRELVPAGPLPAASCVKYRCSPVPFAQGCCPLV